MAGLFGSSDLFIRGYTGLRFPFGSIPFKGVNTWDSPAVGNDRFVGFGMWLESTAPASEEGIGTKLKQVLQPGAQYEFNMHMINIVVILFSYIKWLTK